ncbi:hypothetical protein F4556_003315 [Kitasatospora gansuensis]|uniref:Uncharacterized protein n=1 Tax=Kitasatospora gansuensis TaxID=258050 RepID=A0A7W7SC59_9ACTN|nr:hypothetical protein [Kitasatospora gansuensis]MBB4947780.1 hypothetical protein [Kitasatospora gansuensis]
MDMTPDLAKQCAVIIPALSIAIAVQINAAHAELQRKDKKAHALRQKARLENLKYESGSVEAETIRESHQHFQPWVVAGIFAYFYAGAAGHAVMLCLRFLANSPGPDPGSWNAAYLVTIVGVGFVGALAIPFVKFIEITVYRHESRKLALKSIEEKEDKLD